MPGRNAADESPGVVASPPQFDYGRAADLETANTVNRNRRVSRQILNPQRQGGGGVHRCPGQHIGASGLVPGLTEIQEHRSVVLALFKRGFQLFGRNPRLLLRRRAVREKQFVLTRSFADGPAMPRADPLPIQVCHHLIDIGCRSRAKIEMVGMLIHVDREDRRGT
jgi:hypothetical protein